ncbi:MAG: DNA replication/repair protein RecF [bacterium]|nr:DNA replication/repair protein RecF [bacterium]
MFLNHLLLRNYRNYQELGVSFTKPINIFYGGNTQGKTNLLESIFFAATARSHRTNEDFNLIRWDEPYAYLKAEFTRRNESHRIEIGLAKGEKQLKLDGKVLPRRAELIGNLAVVNFSPDDLYLVKGEPNLRRRFIDLEIAQISAKYLFALQQYHRVVKQRNFAYRQVKYEGVKPETVTVWNDQLVQYGAEIILARKSAIQRLNELVQQNYPRITGTKHKLTLFYDTPFTDDECQNLSGLAKAYWQKLGELKKTESEQAITLLGPHRDDILIFIDGHNLKSFGSQGEQRSAVLAMKLAEVEYMRVQLGEPPLVALDDFMSELDALRIDFVTAELLTQNCQTFITTVYPLQFRDTAAVSTFKIAEGKIL